MSAAICNVPGCTSPAPEDMNNQPRCATCRERVCPEHVVNRDRYSLCPKCYAEQRIAACDVMHAMKRLADRILWEFPSSGNALTKRPLSPADIKEALEGMMTRIREVC